MFSSDEDEMKFEILNDGTIKLESSPISAQNHSNAEAFFQNIARLSGGNTTREKRTDTVHDQQDRMRERLKH